MENYPGSPLEYSASDYHHVRKPTPKTATKRGANLQGRGHNRKRSQFSIVSEDNNNNRDSYYKDSATSASTTTKGSYDPYRSSRTPIVGGAPDQATVILRQATADSQARNASHAASVKNPVLSRLQTEHLSAIQSQEHEKIARPKRHSYTPGTSRSSLASSRTTNCDTGIRKSASYKRQVSFQHHRQKSSGNAGSRSKLSGHQRLVSFEASSSELSARSDQCLVESQSTPSLPTPPQIARPRKPASELDMKKPRAVSHYWKDEARKVSTELGKICEEAFNRSSVSSSTTSHGQPAESPTTSVSIQGETSAIRLGNQLKNRPLPQPPAESLGSYTLHELAEIRLRLFQHCHNDKSNAIPIYVKDTIAHLDRLIEGDRLETGEKRSASDPVPTSARTYSYATTMSKAKETLRSQDIPVSAHDIQALRAASDPVKSNKKLTFEDATIRLVAPDSSSPMQTIQPLNIRKNKPVLSASALCSESSDTLRSNYERGGYESPFFGAGALDTIEEDPGSPRKRGVVGSPGGNRKWSWFKRTSDPVGDSPPTPPMKNSPSRPEAAALETSVSQTSSNFSKAKSSTPDGEEVEAVVEKKRKWFQKMFSRGKAKDTLKTVTSGHEIVQDLSETESNPPSSENLLSELITAKGKKLAKNSNPNSNVTAIGAAGVERPIHISQNWFAKFFHVKPATKLVVLCTTKAKARREIVKLLKEWRKYGLRDVVSEKRAGSGDLIRGRVDDMNCE